MSASVNRGVSNRRTIAFVVLIVVSLALFVGGAMLHLCTGSYPISPRDVLAVLTGGNVTDEVREIILYLRLPRVVVGALVGINLALAGAVFQTITHNEMASPYLLGVSQGSGLVISLTLILFPVFLPILPLVAMIGGVAAFFIVYAIAWKNGSASPVRLILAGVIFGAVAGGVQTVLRYFINDIQTMQNALSWLTGSLVGVGWENVRIVAPWTAIAFIGIVLLARHLDMLLLGEQSASSLGVPVDRIRFFLALFAVLASSSAVAAAGMIGFVGLIVPHIVRTFTGPHHARLIPGCLVAGPALLVLADGVARIAISPMQLPVGIVTGSLGGIFFLYLMKRGRRSFSAGGGRFG